MTAGPTIAQHLSADRLDTALAEAAAALKARPQDTGLRMLLAELCVLGGDLERAETQAKIAQRAASDEAVGIGLFRQYLRGLHARAAWWRDGALPDFPGDPTACDREAIALNVALRAGE
ncbi:MAG: nitrogen fixation protein, partial [Tabrizicola sp.]|nr:nitrogen fixation protein [Tabrizicola sp.]